MGDLVCNQTKIKFQHEGRHEPLHSFHVLVLLFFLYYTGKPCVDISSRYGVWNTKAAIIQKPQTPSSASITGEDHRRFINKTRLEQRRDRHDGTSRRNILIKESAVRA